MNFHKVNILKYSQSECNEGLYQELTFLPVRSLPFQSLPLPRIITILTSKAIDYLNNFFFLNLFLLFFKN